MAVSAGWATLDVIPSVKGLRSEIEKQTRGIDAEGRKAGRRFGDTAGREAGSSFKSRFGNVARDAFGPLLAVGAGAGIVAAFKDVVTNASQAEQAVGGVRAVFGDYASRVEADSRRADDALGLSAKAYQELITLSGALLKNKGLDDYAEQARSLVTVGADLAAQFGGSTREAVDALNAALRGESDPIERYAISLNETAVNAELAANGQKGLTGAALEQAKTQARLALIMRQSADAQGAFGRESNTLAGQQARLSAEWENMRVEVGQELLPALTSMIGFLREDGLPVLSATGGAVKDVAQFVGDLPGPVKAAAGAWVALRVAQAAGMQGFASSTIQRSSSALDTLRLRLMMAGEGYRTARQGQLVLANGSGQFTAGVGRMSAALAGLRAGASGAGAAVRRGLGGAVSMVGGPWGAAFIAGTAILGKFWSEHQEAKAHADSLTSSLNQQTGAITNNTRAQVVDRLEKEGLLAAAERLGVGLSSLTDAALGDRDAVAALQSKYAQAVADVEKYKNAGDGVLSGYVARRNGLENLLDVVGAESATINESAEEIRRKAQASGQDAAATDKQAAAGQRNVNALQNQRDGILKLMDAENERRASSVQARRDQIGLIEAQAAARKEAREGARTLDVNTAAGRKNQLALADLADQWNNSTDKVRNSKGAYSDMRQQFIEVARQMGAGKKEARKLADELLKIPPRKAVTVTTPGMQKALAEAERLRDLLAQTTGAGIHFNRRRGLPGGAVKAFAHGGKVGGTGIGDNQLILADPREWVMRPQAVSYYGDAFMRRLNEMRVPKFANGGQVGGTRVISQPISRTGQHIEQVVVYAQDWSDFQEKSQRAAALSSLDGIAR